MTEWIALGIVGLIVCVWVFAHYRRQDVQPLKDETINVDQFQRERAAIIELAQQDHRTRFTQSERRH